MTRSFCLVRLAGDPHVGRRILRTMWFAIVLLLGLPGHMAQAQDWPQKPVRIVVSNSAGSSPDIVTRMVAERLARAFGQSFLVDNRAGGQGLIGAEMVARAAPDGYTLFMASQDTYAANVFRFRSLPYDPVRDFVPIANVVDSAPFVVAVHPDQPVTSWPELIAHAKQRPGKLSVGVTIGASDALARWMNVLAGIDLLVVPYKVNPEAARAALTGEIQVLLISLPSIEPFVKSGKLRIVAVSSSKRFPQLPDTPTLAEHSPGLVIEGRFLLMGPTGMPAPIVERLNREVDRMLREPEVVQRIRGFGFSSSDAMSPKALAESIQSARETWRRLARDIHMQPE
jgi:tripartite-type tricarboxylate transporter receptor subunit TctC